MSLEVIEELLRKRDIKKTEAAIARALRNKPDSAGQAHLLFLRARARLIGARLGDAMADLDAMQRIMPARMDAPDALEVYADCYFARFELASTGFADRNDAVEAQTTYQTIIERFPAYDNLGWVHYQLGRVLLTANRIDAAIAAFQQALVHPSTLRALTAYCYERLGFVAFYEERNLGKALAFLNRAVDTYPGDEDRAWLVQLHILRSRVLRDMQQPDEAVKAAQDAVATASPFSENRASRSEALFTAAELMLNIPGRERDALNYLQQFTQWNRKPPGIDVTWSRVYEMLGDGYFRLTRYEDALNAYQAALQFNPYHPWELSIYYRISCCYYQLRNYERAIRAIERLLETAAHEGQSISDYRVYDVLGNAYFAQGHYEKALEAYQKALETAAPSATNLDKIRSYREMARQKLNPSL